jgi:disulfide bond formation protein DsbB
MKANPLAWSFRAQFALGLLCCIALLGYALFVQYRMFLDPCPLCILQRVAFMALGLVLLAGLVHNPGRVGRRVYGLLAAVPALVGAAIAGRHVWLQSLPPDQVPACGPGLEYMLDAFPLSKALAMVFTGSGECANVDWQFLGLSMPAWTLVWFLALGALVVWAGFRRR